MFIPLPFKERPAALSLGVSSKVGRTAGGWGLASVQGVFCSRYMWESFWTIVLFLAWGFLGPPAGGETVTTLAPTSGTAPMESLPSAWASLVGFYMTGVWTQHRRALLTENLQRSRSVLGPSLSQTLKIVGTWSDCPGHQLGDGQGH